MAVELLRPDGFANLVKQLSVVFRSTHAAVATGVNVGHVQDGNRALDVVDHFEDFFEASPELLPAGGLDANLRGRAVFDPREDGELVFFVVPNGIEALNHTGEDVRHGLVGFSSPASLTVVAGVEGDVPGVDGAGGLEGRLDLGQGAAKFNTAAEQFAVVRAVDVHLKTGLLSENTCLPVLIEVLRLDHPNGLSFHRLETEGDDVVHALDDRASFARKRDARRSKLYRHLIPPYRRRNGPP